MMGAHMKASSTSTWARDYRTIALYLMENVKHGFTLEQYTYALQLIQAKAMMYAFARFKRLWQGHGNEECAGVLVWQLNDAWPSVSWSLADSNMRRKYAYWSVKRALAPISVGVSRIEVETGRDSEFTEVHTHKQRLQVWGSNFAEEDDILTLEIRGIDVATGKCIWDHLEVAILPKNRSTGLYDKVLSDRADTTVICARLFDGIKVAARYFDWPQPLKYLDLPKPKIKVVVRGDHIHLCTPLPVKGLAFDFEKDDSAVFDDNCIDLVPEDDQVIVARGLAGRKVAFMHLATAV